MTCSGSTSWISLGFTVVVGYFPEQRYHKDTIYYFFLILLKYSWFTGFNFCCTVKWLSYTYSLFSYSFLYGLSWNMEYSSLRYTAGPCCLSILRLRVCICWPQPPNLSLPHPTSPLATKVCFLYLWVCCCFVDMFFRVIFRISHVSDIIWLSFSVWFTSLRKMISRSHPCCCKWHYFILFNVF